jgi:phosphoglycolate phosphatase-like HAD superfamily hydrolase
VREYLQAQYARQSFVLLTATPQEEIDHIARTLEIASCFEQICGSPAKKAVSMAQALQRLQCLPTDALMVGDAEADLAAAEANTVAFLLRATSINRALQERYTGPTFEDLADE